MKKINDLKKLINDLKDETSFDYDAERTDTALNLNKENQKVEKNPLNIPVNINPSYKKPNNIPIHINEKETLINTKFNKVWSENKETLLFGMLSSIIVILIGIFSKEEYIKLIGAISFMLFSLVSFLAFFRYILLASNQEKISSDLKLRIDTLERKMSEININQNSYSNQDIASLNEKINELRTIIKILSKGINKN